MFQTGDYISYSLCGLCKVVDVLWMQESKETGKKQYYFLQPINEKTRKIYTLIDNHKVRLRRLI